MTKRIQRQYYFYAIIQVSVIIILLMGMLSLAMINPVYGADADGLVNSINDVTYIAVPGVSGRLNDLNTQNYKKWLIGNIKIDNNSPTGYTIALKSYQAFEGSSDPDTTNQAAASSRMVHEIYRNTSAVTNHRFVEGAFITYNVTILPKGITTQTTGSPQTEGYDNDNSANDYNNANIHGCYADKSASFLGLTTTTHTLFTVEKALNHTETMSFNLASSPCVDRTGGVTATADFHYDVLISTQANKKLLSGSYQDTIEVILTDI